MHRAGAAVGRVAADVRAGQPQRLTQEVDEQQAGFDLGTLVRTVDGHRDLNRSGHYQLLRVAYAKPQRTLSQQGTVFRWLRYGPARRRWYAKVSWASSRRSSCSIAVKLSERSLSVTRTGVGAGLDLAVGLDEADHDLVDVGLAVGGLARDAQAAGRDVARERRPRRVLVAERAQVRRQDERGAGEVAALAEAERVQQRGHVLVLAACRGARTPSARAAGLRPRSAGTRCRWPAGPLAAAP